MYLLTGIPNRRLIRLQGYLERLNILGAWQHTRGSPTLPVGLIGIGINRVYKELAAKPITGWNIATNSSGLVTDAGTKGLTSSMAALLAGSSVDMDGVAPASPLIVATYSKGLGDDNANSTGVGTSTDAAAAIRKVFDLGAKVVCVPWTWKTDNQALHDACDYVLANGGLVVADTGDNASLGYNTDRSLPRYPASYDSVLCVGGTMADDAAFAISPILSLGAGSHSPFIGPRVDVAAPSSAVVVPAQYKSNYYAIQFNPMDFSGLSSATPGVALVAGIAQLVWSANPALSGAQVKDILTSCVDQSDAGYFFTSFYTKPGCGIADAERAVLRAKALGAPGTVFPYLRLHARPHSDGDYQIEGRSYAVVKPTFNDDGTVRITSHGNALWELGGECSVGPITDVELWINGVQEYHGPPSSKWANPLWRNEHREHLWDLRVVARTATGQEATRTYQTTATSAVGEVHSATYAAPEISDVTDATTATDANTAQVRSPANAEVIDSSASSDATTCLVIAPTSVVASFLLAASLLVAVLYDTAAADTGTFADSVTISQPARQTDTSTGADLSVIGLDIPVADSSSSLDAASASVGRFSAAGDSTTAADSVGATLSLRSAAADAGSQADSVACELIFPATIDVSDTTSSADGTAIVAAIGQSDASAQSDIAYGYLGQLATGSDATASTDGVGISITTGVWIPPAEAPRIKLALGGPVIRIRFGGPEIDVDHAGGPLIRLSLLEEL